MAQRALNKDFREFLKLLIDEEVKFLVIGGYAVTYHGYLRSTDDIDVLVEVSPENATRLVEVVRQFLLPQTSVDPIMFLRPGRIIRFGVPPMRIEIHTRIPAVEFDSAYSRAAIERIDGLELRILSLADLRANKQACARPKDIEDLRQLPPA